MTLVVAVTILAAVIELLIIVVDLVITILLLLVVIMNVSCYINKINLIFFVFIKYLNKNIKYKLFIIFYYQYKY